MDEPTGWKEIIAQGCNTMRFPKENKRKKSKHLIQEKQRWLKKKKQWNKPVEQDLIQLILYKNIKLQES